jgi:hypothetical protein
MEAGQISAGGGIQVWVFADHGGRDSRQVRERRIERDPCTRPRLRRWRIPL